VSIFLLGPPLIPGDYTEEQWHEKSEQRSRRVDTFVAICLVAEILCLLLLCRHLRPAIARLALAFVVWRVIDILATDLRVSLFESFDRRRDTERNKDLRYVYSSPSRVIVLGVINYLELIVCFAAIYAFGADHVTADLRPATWLFASNPVIEKCLHLSFVTQITVGYGDLVPNGWLRPVAWLQCFAGLGIVALLIARYMTVLPGDRGLRDERAEECYAAALAAYEAALAIRQEDGELLKGRALVLKQLAELHDRHDW
jgi:hypothetical protein